MELVSFTFAAGETKRFERAGRYLEIIDATAAVNISLTDESGGAVDYATGALSGLYMEGAFSAITIYSATAQTVELLITDGRGGSRRQPGNVRIIDEVMASSLAYSIALPTAISAFTATVILPPADNVAGFVLRSLHGWAQSGVGGAMNLRVYAAAAAPVAFGPSGAQMILADMLSSGGEMLRFEYPDFKKVLPAGWGVYACSAIVSAAASQGNASLSGNPL